MKRFWISIVLAPAAAFVLFATSPALAQGYAGLIADDEDAAVTDNTDSYDGGILAPAETPRRGGRAQQQEPPGYEGLVPGYVPPRTPQQTETAEPLPTPHYPGQQLPQTKPANAGITPRPGAASFNRVSNAEHLMNIAALSKVAGNLKALPKPLLDRLSANKHDYAVQFGPGYEPPMINGMSPLEMSAKNAVDMIMNGLRDPKASAADKQRLAREGYKRLLFMSDGIAAQRSVPTEMYEYMGFPKNYIDSEKDSHEKAWQRIQEGLRALREYQ